MWGGGGSYNAWVSFLERWAAGEPVDPAGLPRIALDDFTGDGHERLANRLSGALSARLQRWAAGLTRAIGEARDEFGVARALVQARAGLAPIRALAAHPGLPDEFTTGLVSMVDTQIRSAQGSLEDQVESMRRDGAERRAVEARLRTIRDNPLTTVLTAAPGGDNWHRDLSVPPRRRVVG